jgi:cysteine desulfurase
MKLWSNSKTQRVYADAAAATPLSFAVKAEMMRLIDLFANPSALHKEAVAADQELLAAREKIAKTLCAHADEIIFTSGGTEANNLAVFGVLQNYLKAGERVHAITSAIEHASVLEPLRALTEMGLMLTELAVDTEGKVDPKKLREAITDETVFVSVQMVNSEIGTVQDIREIAKEVRRTKKERSAEDLPLYVHTDASQAPLWLLLNVEKLGVDLMTFDAQKMMGPKGSGVLFVRRSITLSPLIYGGGQEGGRRSGTESVLLAGAFAVALEEAQTGVEKRADVVSKVRNSMIYHTTQRIPGVILNGAKGEGRVANNINIQIPGLNGDMAVVAMDAEGVAISTRSACDTDDEAPSHVLQAIGVASEQAKNSIRITLLPGATMGEARRIAKTLSEVYARYSHRE